MGSQPLGNRHFPCLQRYILHDFRFAMFPQFTQFFKTRQWAITCMGSWTGWGVPRSNLWCGPGSASHEEDRRPPHDSCRRNVHVHQNRWLRSDYEPSLAFQWSLLHAPETAIFCVVMFRYCGRLALRSASISHDQYRNAHCGFVRPDTSLNAVWLLRDHIGYRFDLPV